MNRIAAGAVLATLCAAGAERPKAAPDPRVLSVFPSAIATGRTARVTVRGSGLAGARALVSASAGLMARITGVRSEPAPDGDPVDLIDIEASGPAGSHSFRIVATQGVTNELPFTIVDEPVVDPPQTDSPLRQFPVVIAGALRTRGAVDTVWVRAGAGETLTFHCTPGTAGFDPSLVLSEPAGSWFDPARLIRIAFNDEPLFFPGLSTEAHLVHRFEKGGKYALQVRAFSGQGGPDFTYSLRISRGLGPAPSLHPRAGSQWDERRFTRWLATEWLGLLATRGIPDNAPQRPRAYRGVAASSAELPVVAIPGIVEGRLSKPAETHQVRVRLDAALDLAIEVETPRATMPRFNPVVRLLAADGTEMVTNVHTKRNNNGLYMMKMIQAKSTFTLRLPGEYLMEIRDITTDIAADDFDYRILIRPQIPHAGKAEITEDRVNLAPGESKAVTVQIEREEGFNGLLLLSAEGLPDGVTAAAGMANPIEKPPLPNGGRLERYVGRPQIATLLFTASASAAPSELPSAARVSFRVIVDGKPGPLVKIKDLPVMVIPKRPS